VPITLALEDLKVRVSETVSYVLAGIPADGSSDRVVFSRTQVIVVRNSAPPASRSRGGGNPAEQAVVAAIQGLQRAQREIVDRAQALENEAATPARRESLTRIETDQRTVRNDAASVTETYSQILRPEHIALLNEARTEMQNAEQAWQREQPAIATPAAVRALAALTKLLEEGGLGDGPGGGGNNPGQASDYSTTMNNAFTLASSPEIVGATNAAGIPPPPGPNAEPREIREYAGLLSDRIGGLIQLAEEAERQAKRKEVLTTANPAEAPPSYRPAVADYFEKLARERPASPGASP
jgi:hypothetical protein